MTMTKLRIFVVGLPGSSFSVEIQSSEEVDSLQEAIKEKKTKDLEPYDANRLNLYKVKLETGVVDGKDLAQRAHQALEKLKAEALSKKETAELDSAALLSKYFDDEYWNTAKKTEMVHVLVETPPNDVPPAPHSDGFSNATVTTENVLVTFVAPLRGQFGEFNQALSSNNIINCSTLPDFINEVEKKLSRHRFYHPDQKDAEFLQGFLVPDAFSSHFLAHVGNSNTSSSDISDTVSNMEFHEYNGIFRRFDLEPVVSDVYSSNKEQYIYSILLGSAMAMKHSYGKSSSYTFGKGWDLPLVAKIDKVDQRCKYQPKSDFCFSVDGLPYIVLEVCSDPLKQSDLTRMLVQAACLVRFGNRLDPEGSPFVAMAIYIAANLKATRYLCYQTSHDNQVNYTEIVFDLRNDGESFEFLFQLYNFVNIVKAQHPKNRNVRADLQRLKQQVAGLDGFTSARGEKKRKRPTSDEASKEGGHQPDTRGHTDSSTALSYDDPSVRGAIFDAGYSVYEGDDVEGWDPINPTTGVTEDGVHVVLKLVEKRELSMLQYFQKWRCSDNHVIRLLDIVDFPKGSCIVMPLAQPLPDYEAVEHNLDLIDQFMSGVAFMHAKGVAHLDLKPANIVVKHGERPRLHIIDLGVSVFADTATEMEGFVGTPPWVAPEVGSRDGPTHSFNPIRADLWATGQILIYLMCWREEINYGRLSWLAQRLTSTDPSQRPTSEDWLKVGKRKDTDFSASDRCGKVQKVTDASYGTDFATLAFIFSAA